MQEKRPLFSFNFCIIILRNSKRLNTLYYSIAYTPRNLGRPATLQAYIWSTSRWKLKKLRIGWKEDDGGIMAPAPTPAGVEGP